MAKKLNAVKQFRRRHAQLVKTEARIAAALERQKKKILQKKNVIGFGVSQRAGRYVAVFFVTRKVKTGKLLPKDRLPRSITVGGKRFPTDVRTIQRPSTTAGDPIGDPTENRRSYHYNGKGDWKMGVGISIFKPQPPGAPKWVNAGTAGARVVSKKDPNEHLVLTCGHVVKAAGLEVAQQLDDRDPPPGSLFNFVGQVKQVSADFGDADAGTIECVGALQEILPIGKPRPLVFPYVGMFVQKSSWTTGLTWSQISETNVTCISNLTTYTGLFSAKNYCMQDPSAPGKLKAGVPVDKFSFGGDSGALIVLGKPNQPGVWGDPGLQRMYDQADAAEKVKIRDEWERAALGLNCLASDDWAYGQIIIRALAAMKVHLEL